MVIAPGGKIIAGRLRRQKGILYAEVDAKQAVIAKRDLDISGHYSRPDIFSLSVNMHAQSPITLNQ